MRSASRKGVDKAEIACNNEVMNTAAVETPAKLLRRWRKAEKLTKKAAASKLGVNEITYGRAEKGDVPNAATLRKLTVGTGVSAELWLRYAEQRKRRGAAGGAR